MEKLIHNELVSDELKRIDPEGEKIASPRRRKNAVRASSVCHGSFVVYSVLASIVFLILQTIIPLVLEEELAEAVAASPYFFWASQVVAMYIISFPIFLLLTRNIPSRKVEPSKMSLGEFVTIFMIGEGLAVIGNIISQILTSAITAFTGEASTNQTMEYISEAPLWVVIVVAVVIGPIVEEVIFRKVFIDKLSVYGDRLAIIVSSVAFGFMHGNLYQLFYATALGILFGYVYTKTRRLRYSCLLHMLVNFMGTVPALVMAPGLERLSEFLNSYTGGDIPTEEAFVVLDAIVSVYSFVLVQYGLAIAGIVLLIVLTIKRAYRVPASCECRLPARTVTRVAFFNSGTIIFFLWCGLNILLSLFPDAAQALLGAASA